MRMDDAWRPSAWLRTFPFGGYSALRYALSDNSGNDGVKSFAQPLGDHGGRQDGAAGVVWKRFHNRVLADDAGSEVLRRAGFFDIRSGSSDYLLKLL
jgi:hypothetical protein